MSQALHLLNGDTTQNKIAGGNVVGKLMQAKLTDDQIVEDLYVRCLARRPDPSEAAGVKKSLAEYKEKKKGFEDLFWSLLNSKEFMFNH